MPRIQKTESEKQQIELRARLNYLMQKNSYNNEKLAKLLRISVSSLIRKKKDFGLFSFAQIQIMEKAFQCKMSEPLQEVN